MTASLLPNDEHNRRLAERVHPPGWANPVPAARYHLVVIGAGVAGLVTAAIGAALGARVALVEEGLMGGDCLNFGCVPSKAILRSARAAADCRRAGGFGIKLGGEPQADFASVMERMRRLRGEISENDSAERFRGLGVDVFLGRAAFVGREAISAGDARLRFRSAVIATGARPAVPPIEGLAAAGYLTNETVFSLERLPARLAVIGGGPQGCELAQAFARFGSRVAVIEAMPQFLPAEDADAAALLRKTLEREGVEVRLGARIARVETGGGAREIVLSADGKEERLVADEILVGAGRAPNVGGMNLEAAGVEFDPAAGIRVNDALQTSNPRIFAAGDVCSAWKFTHAADFAARIAAQNALFPFLPKKKFSRLVIPRCVYADPEIASVGASSQELARRGIAHETIYEPMSRVDRAVLDGETDGFVKIRVAARGGGRILGATIAAPHAGEMIGQITQAMVRGIRLGSMASVIYPYPTQAEAIRRAADQFNRRRLTPGRKKLLGWLIRRFG